MKSRLKRTTQESIDAAGKVQKRTQFTNEEKLDILNWYNDNGQKQTFTVEHYKPVFPTFNQSTLSLWLKDEEGTRERCESNLQTIRQRNVKNPEFEAALSVWIDQVLENPNSRITGDVIKEVVCRFYDLLEISEENRLQLSNGWLTKFLNRHGMKLYHFHGEASSAPIATLGVERIRLANIIQTFLNNGHTLDDVWNMDETALFYAAIPDQGLARQTQAGVKQLKTRLTLAVTVNASGTETLDPMFIGKAFKPRCFGKKTGKQLGFQYFNNSKAWMTGELFEKWLLDWNAELLQMHRKVLLFVDNFAGHKVEVIPSNIQLEFLAPNLTAFIQPCDAGIIRAFKGIYRRKVVMRSIDKLFRLEIEKDIFKIDQLTAMNLARYAWKDVMPEAIKHCWEHTGILPRVVTDVVLTDPPISNGTDKYVQDLIHKLQMDIDLLSTEADVRNRPLDLMPAETFVCIDDDSDAILELTVEQIVALVKQPQYQFECEDETALEEIAEEKVTDKSALSTILDLDRYFVENGICIPMEVQRFMGKIQSDIRENISYKKVQKTIYDYFPKANSPIEIPS